MFEIGFDQDWSYYWQRVPREQHSRLLKKMEELREEKRFRHLKLGLPHFAIEIGQYRICFTEEGHKRILDFVGDHKAYEKWLGLR